MPIQLRMAYVYDVRSPTHRYGTQAMAEQLKSLGIGVELKLYPGSQLGNEEELLEQLVAGELDLAIAGPSFLAMWHPPIGVFDASYAFRDLNHILDFAASPTMAVHWNALKEKYGVRVLETWAYGTRHITSNRPIRGPDDLAGFRLRMPSARIWQASGQALGASPLPISFGEVYLALQQGIADGQENPISVIQAMGFHEVQDYLNLTAHSQSCIHVLVNEKTWTGLTPSQQQAIETALFEVGKQVYQGIINEEHEIVKHWQENNILQVVDDVDIASFRQRSQLYFSKGFVFSDMYAELTGPMN